MAHLGRPLFFNKISLHFQGRKGLFLKALAAPLAGLEVIGASGCLLLLEGGRQMSIYQMEQVADAFTRGLTEDAQVILGARHSDDLDGKMRVVAVVSGL